MHVLILSAGYPTTYNPTKALFHQHQADSLAMINTVGVIAIVPISIKEILTQLKFHFGWRTYVKNGVFTSVYQYCSLPKFKFVRLKMPLWIGKRMVNRYIKVHGRPEVIHLHSFHAGALAIWVKEKYSIPYVVTEHSSVFLSGNYSDQDKYLAEITYKNSSQCIAVSKYFKKALMSQFNVDFKSVSNCVDTDFFQPSKVEKKGLQLLNVGHFKPNKNQKTLAKAFLKVFDENEQVRIVFVGEGEERSKVKAEFVRRGRMHQCVFAGNQTREQIRDWYNQSHLYISSSYRETFGIVLIEAMSMGLPLLATQSEGSRSVIISEDLGRLVGFSEEEMAAGIIQMKKSLMNFNAEVIRDHAVQNYSREVLTQTLCSIYGNIK